MAAPYRVEFTAGAARQFRKLPPEARSRVAARIDVLSRDPRPAGVVAVKRGAGALRLRVGDHRILYRVEDERLLVLVVRIGHRREVYDR